MRTAQAVTRLVGRERELADLDAAYEAAAAGSFQCVLVLGDPGVGKTRLVQEVLSRRRDTALGLWARGHPLSDTASFALWIEALERHLRELDPKTVFALCDGLPDDLATLLRSVAKAHSAASPQQQVGRPRLLESLGALIAKLAADQPLIVVLDDIHQADSSSWDMLHYLAGRRGGQGTLVIAPARTGELTRQPVAMRVLLDLEQHGALRRMVLGTLSGDAMRELAEDFLGERLEPGDQQLLVDRSRGNPFYALGLLEALRHDSEALAVGLPDVVADGVRARVAALDDDGRATLELLSIAGGRLELGELFRVGDLSLDELGPALRSLVDARMVLEEPSGPKWAYEISHPLIAETVDRDTGAARRTAIHRRVARLFLAAGRLDEAAQHFAHSADAGDDEAVSVLTQALVQADHRGAYGEGIKLLGVLGDIVPAGAPQWGAIADGLHNWMGDHRVDSDTGTAAAALLKIDELPPESLNDYRRATVKARLVTLLGYGTGELDRAADAAQEAIRLFESAGTETEILLARLELAYVRALRGDVSAWTRDIERIIERARELSDDAVLEPAIGAYGHACFLAGRFSDAEAAYRHAITLVPDQEPHRAVRHSLRMGWALGYEGRGDEALAAFALAKTNDPHWRESAVLEMEACVRWLVGDFGGALTCASESALLGLSFRRGIGLCVTALASTEADDITAARRALETAAQIYGGPSEWFYATDLFRHAVGTVAWHTGRTLEAAATLALASSHLIKIGAPVLAAPILVDRAELAAECGDANAASDAATTLREIASRSDSPLITDMATLAEAWMLASQGLVAPAIHAATTAAKALNRRGYRVLEGRSLLALGHAQRGEPAVEVQTLQEAASVLNEAGAVWRRDRVLQELRGLGTTGRRAAATALGADALTPREWEVARLVVQRLSAQEIADLFVVSRRTVESHVGGIYLKLGVHSKDELIRALAGRDV